MFTLVRLTSGQLEKLSDLFIDLSKGLFLASIAVPIIAKDAAILESLRAFILGGVFTHLSLKAVKLSEERIRR